MHGEGPGKSSRASLQPTSASLKAPRLWEAETGCLRHPAWQHIHPLRGGGRTADSLGRRLVVTLTLTLTLLSLVHSSWESRLAPGRRTSSSRGLQRLCTGTDSPQPCSATQKPVAAQQAGRVRPHPTPGVCSGKTPPRSHAQDANPKPDASTEPPQPVPRYYRPPPEPVSRGSSPSVDRSPVGRPRALGGRGRSGEERGR
ncbi:hypothetical protein JHW43_007809 [Diplocarpon mali]|nr:hypothetical protein JHW43_007809 [Diplocarpon mali]